MTLSRKAQVALHLCCIWRSVQGIGRAVTPASWVDRVALLVALSVLSLLLFSGCEKKPSAKVSNFSLAALPSQPIDHYGEPTYAVANPEWVEQFYASEFRPYLSKTLVKWDESFDCNKFAALFAAMAQVRYLAESWHQWNAPKALGIGEVWVVRPTGNHSLVCVLTAQGEKYFEPQTGKFVEAGGWIYFRRL